MSMYSGDPYWLSAKFKSKCSKCGAEIKKGEQIFYYPKCKSVFCSKDSCGGNESASFNASAADEDFYNGGY